MKLGHLLLITGLFAQILFGGSQAFRIIATTNVNGEIEECG